MFAEIVYNRIDQVEIGTLVSKLSILLNSFMISLSHVLHVLLSLFIWFLFLFQIENSKY